MLGIINRIWQAASSKRLLSMFDWQEQCEGHTCVASLIFSVFSPSLCCSYSLKLLVVGAATKKMTHKGLNPEGVGYLLGSELCGPVCFTRSEAKNTNPHSLCPRKPLLSFYAPGSNIVYCYGLSVLLQVLSNCLVSLLCFFSQSE